MSLDLLSKIFEPVTYGLVVYFLIANFTFLALLIASFISIRQLIFARPMIESIWKRTKDLGPAVSLIAPCYNEARSILFSVKSFLALDYPRTEIIIVNDGSTDQTLELLKKEFQLSPARVFYDDRLSKSKILGIYRSGTHQNLIVIDKQKGGKADAINVGIGFSDYDIFCAVDADCILDRDALLKVILPFIEEPDLTVAAGGTVRPINGSQLRASKPLIPKLPTNPLVLFQVVEYLRAFLFGRVGWNVFNATMIISGAFGIFKKQAVIEVGGYREGSVGEDMELVVRLRRRAGELDEPAVISFIPDPICWTEVPSDLLSLGRQRDRWQRGLAESLLFHREMFFNRRYGFAGLLAYPVFFFFELLQPFVQLLSYVFIIAGWSFGWISWDLFILFLVVDLAFGTLMSFGAVLIEESAFHKYPKLTHLVVLLFFALFEHIGYRQYIMFWRVWGGIKFFAGDRGWGRINREGFASS